MTNLTDRCGVRRRLLRAACGAAIACGSWAASAQPVDAAPAQSVQAPTNANVVGLAQGATGANVKAVQTALIAKGISVPGGADGQFGPATRGAVTTFQAANGLAQTGVVDAATAAALGLTTAPQPSITPPPARAVVGLEFGATGPAVKELQQKLMAQGVYVAGGADGQFGRGTKTAVTNFQRWNGLTVSGVVDSATASRLGLTGSPGAPEPPPVTPPVTPDPPPVVTPDPPPVSANPFVGLTVGARGADVKVLQQKLIDSGVVVRGGADGIFGNATKAALVEFQAANGQPQTGIVTEHDANLLQVGTSTPPVTPPTTPPISSPVTAPPPTTTTNPYVGLAVGARGQLVKDLQQALIDAGINVRGGADGVFGNATKTALMSYQGANGLGVSGSLYEASATKLGLGVAAPEPTPPPVPDPVPNPPAPEPPPVSTNPYVGLTVGATGAMVTELQRALMATGLVVRGGADGVFGSATKSALVAFQSVNDIPQTGIVTEKGAGILNLGAATPPPSTPPNGFATATGFPVKGETSERVRLLQEKLMAWGITVVGGADGSFGNATATAIRQFQGAHGVAVTGTITQETADKMGITPSDPTPPATPATVVMARFPIQGQCYYGNTWGAPRGGTRTHEGVDILASEGNLLYAVVDGTISKMYWDTPGALSGNGLRVAEDDGTYFTYLHMQGFAPGVQVGTKVLAGDVIGFVGNTGSSATPHLHFEIHPGGGGAVNPYPYVKAIDDCGNTTPQYQSSFAPA